MCYSRDQGIIFYRLLFLFPYRVFVSVSFITPSFIGSTRVEAMILVTACIIITILMIIDRWKSKKLKEAHAQMGNDTLYIPVIGHAYNFIGNNESEYVQ